MTTVPAQRRELRPDLKQLKDKIWEHIDKAMAYRDAALVSERKANERHAALVREAAREQGGGRPASTIGSSPKDVADRRAGDDPTWKGHAADNRWHLDQSLVESNLAMALMKAMELEIIV